MQKRLIVRTAALVVVWAYAGATWASIGHHMLGIPDLVPFFTLGSAGGALAWALRPRAATRVQRVNAPQDEPVAAR